jgi:hypothetical protein
VEAAGHRLVAALPLDGSDPRPRLRSPLASSSPPPGCPAEVAPPRRRHRRRRHGALPQARRAASTNASVLVGRPWHCIGAPMGSSLLVFSRTTSTPVRHHATTSPIAPSSPRNSCICTSSLLLLDALEVFHSLPIRRFVAFRFLGLSQICLACIH